MSIWDYFVWFFWLYIFFSCIWIFITVFIDLFRDSTLGGFAKFGWVIFLVLVPFLAAFIYLIARGRSMGERNLAAHYHSHVAQDDYMRAVAASSTTSEIAAAKKLLDDGAINADEFEKIKAKAIA